MIGTPFNFQHTVHVGSNDVNGGESHLNSVESQLHTKGGYTESSSSSSMTPRHKMIDIQPVA